MKLIGGSSCGQEPSQTETHCMATAIEAIEVELKKLQENDGLYSFTDSKKFHGKAGEGHVAAKKVGSTHPPNHFPRSSSQLGQDNCEALRVPPHTCSIHLPTHVSRGHSTATVPASRCQACHATTSVPWGV
eukprot:TRINITY_DN18672_c0_g1_i7.p1 TRINITY_DN18672_c0_g1~~TRINITY_DN18672_c0_g1_i7.p1  ORF type:complete len:131 (-),score=15.08 TRINITY_DN18672_c0_g1_i7:45-437(-)